MPVPREVEESARPPGTEVRDHYKWLCGCWDLNLELEEQANAICPTPKALDLSYKTAEVNHAFPPVVPFCGDGHALTAFSHSCFAVTVMIPLISRLHRRRHETQEDTDFLAM